MRAVTTRDGLQNPNEHDNLQINHAPAAILRPSLPSSSKKGSSDLGSKRGRTRVEMMPPNARQRRTEGHHLLGTLTGS